MMKYFVFVFVFLISGISFAQKIKVLDKETGKIVKNVNVFNETETISLTTNNAGYTDISSIKENEVIFFSHLSYAVKRIKKGKIRKQKLLRCIAQEARRILEWQTLCVSLHGGKFKVSLIQSLIRLRLKVSYHEIRRCP